MGMVISKEAAQIEQNDAWDGFELITDYSFSLSPNFTKINIFSYHSPEKSKPHGKHHESRNVCNLEKFQNP